jgi:hypothetical protein
MTPTAPLLEISENSVADENYAHGATRWQITADASFSEIIMDITVDSEDANGYLYSFQVSNGILSGGQDYYWRAKVKGLQGSDSTWSEWSESFRFTTASSEYTDIDANGVGDDFEPAYSDLDKDGTNDNDQAFMRVITGIDGRSLIGLKSLTGVEAIEYYGCVAPTEMPETGRPVDLPLGMINFRVQTSRVGGTAAFEIYLSEIPREAVRWFKCDPVDGWYEFPVVREPGKFVFEITDGGPGDTDGAANGIIVDPLGASYAPDSDTGGSAAVSPLTSDGGSSCFIGSCSKRGEMKQLIKRLWYHSTF